MDNLTQAQQKARRGTGTTKKKKTQQAASAAAAAEEGAGEWAWSEAWSKMSSAERVKVEEQLGVDSWTPFEFAQRLRDLKYGNNFPSSQYRNGDDDSSMASSF
jgi:hypothetical protein